MSTAFALLRRILREQDRRRKERAMDKWRASVATTTTTTITTVTPPVPQPQPPTPKQPIRRWGLDELLLMAHRWGCGRSLAAYSFLQSGVVSAAGFGRAFQHGNLMSHAHSKGRGEKPFCRTEVDNWMVALREEQRACRLL